MTKLILHFDVNKTILLADKVQNKSFEDCLAEVIKKYPDAKEGECKTDSEIIPSFFPCLE